MTFSCPKWPPPWPEIGLAARQSIESGQWGQYHTETHRVLATQIAELAGRPHCRLVGSGSAGIELALKILGVGPGDEVILAAFDYPGNLRSVEATGARPVLVDLAAGSTQIDIDSLLVASGNHVKAVLASHLYGTPAPITEIREICDSKGWKLVEDACQNPGTDIHGRPSGNWGDIGVFSFGGSKPLTAGNGGALVSCDDRHAAKWKSMLDRPSDTQPLSSLQAAVLPPQLAKLAEMNALRAATARRLAESSERWRGWKLISRLEESPTPKSDAAKTTIYKLAWAARDESTRDLVVQQGREMGLPIGPAFRSMDGCSPRRCRKPVPLINSAQMSKTMFVLDHSSLMIEPEQHDELVDALNELHDQQQ